MIVLKADLQGGRRAQAGAGRRRRTHDTKASMVQQMYMLLVDGRIVISDAVVSVGRADFDARKPSIPITEQVQSLSDQLRRFKDHDDGTISGKNTASGDNDDLAMALMLTVFWSISVRMSDPSIQDHV